MPLPSSERSVPVGNDVAPTAQRGPGASALDDSAGYLIKQIMVSFVAVADKRLGALDLTHAQWAPLMRLRTLGASTVAEMARWLQVDAGATTRLLDRLERKGLCRRSRSTSDRRVVHVSITPEGMAATAQAPAVLTDILDAHLAGFSASERGQLVALLRRMRDNAEALRESAQSQCPSRP